MISPTFFDPGSSKRDFPIYHQIISWKVEYLDTLKSLFEGECHSTTDNQSIDFCDEIVNQLNLIGNFCTSENSQERSLGFLEGFGKVLEFFLHKESGSTFREFYSDHG